jgi:starvation-inducible DNA-binding protein
MENMMMQPPKGDSDLAQHLAKVLGSVVTFQFLAQGYHWNVKGRDFYEFHAFFGEIYEDAHESVDPLAENIRKLGYEAPYFLSDFVDLSVIDGGQRQLGNATEMARSLYVENMKLVEALTKAFNVADNCNEQGIADFLAGRIDMHNKWAWQLSAVLNEEIAGY